MSWNRFGMKEVPFGEGRFERLSAAVRCRGSHRLPLAFFAFCLPLLRYEAPAHFCGSNVEQTKQYFRFAPCPSGVDVEDNI